MSYCAYTLTLCQVTKMLILGAWCTVPPKAPTVAAKRTYVGLIHIIEDDNEYESFFIDPTSFWLSAVHYQTVAALKW